MKLICGIDTKVRSTELLVCNGLEVKINQTSCENLAC